jgi:hypothetical protein
MTLLAFVFTAGAQDNYTIKMKMHLDGLPPEAAAFSDMDIVNYIKGNKLKSERTGMMGSSITLIDGEKLTSLNDQMGNKFGYTATKTEIEEQAKADKSEKPKIEYINEKKTIAGYECSKAIITSVDKDKKENKATVWYTDKIAFKNGGMGRAQGRQGMDLSDLKGYPLAMEMSDSSSGQEMKFTMTATEISTTPVDESVFTISTDGYKMMTYKEMLERQKNARGPGR